METKYSAPNVQLEFQCAVPTLATCPPSSRVTAPGHQAATSREGNHETSHNPELDLSVLISAVSKTYYLF